jgi:hypothetical protein
MQRGRVRIAACLIVAAAIGAATLVTHVQARTAVQRDVESYAVASCLAAQDQPYLKDQGDGWASAIIQRSKGRLDIFTSVAAAVKAELAKGHTAVIRSESGEAKDKLVPVMSCGEIIDSLSVHDAIDKAVKKLIPYYRGQ